MPVSFRREKSRQVLSQGRKQGNVYHVAEKQMLKPARLLTRVDEGKSKEKQPRQESQISTSTTTLIFHGSSAGSRRVGPPACDPPSAIHCNCSLTSCTFWKRSSGSLAIQVFTTRSNAGGAIGCTL